MELCVCVGESCHLKGAEFVVTTFKTLIEKENLGHVISLKGSFCMGRCADKAVIVKVNDQFKEVNRDEANDFFYNSIIPLLDSKK